MAACHAGINGNFVDKTGKQGTQRGSQSGNSRNRDTGFQTPAVMLPKFQLENFY